MKETQLRLFLTQAGLTTDQVDKVIDRSGELTKRRLIYRGRFTGAEAAQIMQDYPLSGFSRPAYAEKGEGDHEGI